MLPSIIADNWWHKIRKGFIFIQFYLSYFGCKWIHIHLCLQWWSFQKHHRIIPVTICHK